MKQGIEKQRELPHEFRKVAGCKANVQKSIGLLCVCTEQSENENKKTIPITTAPKNTMLRTKFSKRSAKFSVETTKHC